MCYQVIQKVIPFVLTFSISALLVVTLESFLSREQAPAALQRPGTGCGSGYGGSPLVSSETRGPIAPLRVTFQPKALYTDVARENNVQGAVRLKITLLANGTVGNITPVTSLPDGLTEQAIAAARQIKFEPKMVGGEPVSVVVTREYVFTIY